MYIDYTKIKEERQAEEQNKAFSAEQKQKDFQRIVLLVTLIAGIITILQYFRGRK